MPKKKTPAPASPKGPTTGRQSTSQPQYQQIPLALPQLNGWPRLRELVSRGFKPGEFSLILARPSTGKSDYFRLLGQWEAARRQQLEGHRAIIQAIQSLWPSR